MRNGFWISQLFLKLKPWSLSALLIALSVVAGAVGLRMLLSSLGATFYFATFFPAVLLASLFAGVPAGACTAVLSVSVVWWAFLPPLFAFSRLSPADYRDFTMFLLGSGLLIWFAQLCREAMTLQRMESSGEF